MVILGIILILVAIFLFYEGKHSKGAGMWFILACILLALGLGFLVSPITSAIDSKSSSSYTPNSVYSPNGQSGTTDLQKKRQEWQKKSNDAYQSGGYWRYD